MCYSWTETFFYFGLQYRVYLFVLGFSSNSRIFHLYGDFTFTNDCCKFWPSLALVARFVTVTHLLWHGASPRTRDTHTHTHTHTHTPVAERLAVELSLILILKRGVGIIHFTGITNILPLISLIECWVICAVPGVLQPYIATVWWHTGQLN